MTASTALKPASPNQLAFLKTLVEERQATEELTRRLDAARDLWRQGSLSSYLVSGLIVDMKACPKKSTFTAAGAAPMPEVPEGYYALRNVPGYSNEVSLFSVDEGSGRHAGRIFVSLFSSDNRMPIRGEGAHKVLTLIAADPQAAQMLFSTETVRCYRCARRLTDDESRALGIGPTCRGSRGRKVTADEANRDWAEMKNEAARREAAQELEAYRSMPV